MPGSSILKVSFSSKCEIQYNGLFYYRHYSFEVLLFFEIGLPGVIRDQICTLKGLAFSHAYF